MSKRLLCAALLPLCLAAQTPTHGVGRAPTAEELAAMDITIGPDGAGLPQGSGTVAEGKDIYSRRCQRCHGAEGKGGEEGAPLIGGQGTLNTAKPVKTVGSYWPYATTLFDYIRRAMPFNQPGSLTSNQVYALSAYILQLNGIVAPDAKLDAGSLPKVRMPNRDGFIADPRPDTGKKK